MANKKSSKSPNWHRPSDKVQKTRTFRNKARQRLRHAKLHPNDTSVKHAQRWMDPAGKLR